MFALSVKRMLCHDCQERTSFRLFVACSSPPEPLLLPKLEFSKYLDLKWNPLVQCNARVALETLKISGLFKREVHQSLNLCQ